MSEKVTDHVAQALANLISPFSATPLVRELATIFVGRLQGLEDVFWDVLQKRVLGAAEGITLDIIGKILGEPRGSLDDDDYTSVLQVVAAINQSDAGAREVAALAAELLEVPVRYIQLGSLGYELQYETATPLSGDFEARVQRLMEALRPALATLTMVEGDTSGDPAGVPFTLDTDGAGLDEGELCRRII